MPTPSHHTIDLGLGFFLDLDVTDHLEFDWDLRWKSLQIAQGSFSLGAPSGPTPVSTDVVRGEIEVTLDPLSGAVGAVAKLELLEPGVEPPKWKTVVDRTFSDIAYIDPTKGEVAGSPDAHPPTVQGFGPNGPSGDGVTRFHISDEPRLLAGVGSIVKQRLFADTPPLTLNIIACCGRPTGPPTGPGTYADPTSDWFNVFFGVYQMDCAKADGWTRPFGYQSAQGVSSAIQPEDLARVGKADWNWFSNYLYGVPEEVCIRYSSVDMSKVKVTAPTTVEHGTSRWHQISMTGVEVASAYQSDAPGAQKLVENSVLTPTWQSSFGLPCPRPGYPTSFIPTVLSSTLLMAYTEDDDGFHTLMFGGTANASTAAAFLAAQVTAAVATIEQSYPNAGFPLSS